MSFLNRLRRSRDARPEDELERIVRNLGQILNTRKEHGSVVPSFGLGDYEGSQGRAHGTREALAALEAELLDEVQRYEPRLGTPRLVRLGRDPNLWLRFHLHGEVDGTPRRLLIKLHTTSREVRVEVA